MSFKVAVLFMTCVLAASCSKEGNPVALPTVPGGPASPLALSVKADQSQLVAGTSRPANLTVTALHTDGSPATDGTTVTLNTTLGGFSFDAEGKPVQLATATLIAGRATTQFFPGIAPGTASILASLGTTVASPICRSPRRRRCRSRTSRPRRTD